MLDIYEYVKDRIQGKAPKGAKRSSQWRKVRAEHLSREPKCCSCGGTKKLEVHHIQSFHARPDLELVPSNLMTLCRQKKYGISCHQNLGHRGNYRDINENVIKMADEMFKYLEPRHGETKD